MSAETIGLVMIFGTVAIATMVGLASRLGVRKMTMEQWTVGGRSFGQVLIWVLMAGEIYTTFTFLGESGWAYSRGAAAFYILAYCTVAFILSYFVMVPVWRAGRRFGFVTNADLFSHRFDSRWLGVLVAVIGVIYVIPYLVLQLTGLGIIINIASYGAISPKVAIVIGFVATSLFVLVSGLRATAWVGVLKDVTLIVAVVVFGLLLPIHYFGGVGSMFRALEHAHPGHMTFPVAGQPQYSSLWYFSTVLLTGCGFYMWPHLFSATYSARSGDSIKRNSILLPFYQLGLLFPLFVGFTALLIIHPRLSDPDSSFLSIVQSTFPPGALGFVGAAGVLAAMVPASALLLTACTLIVRNIYSPVFRHGKRDTQAGRSSEDQMVARWARILVPVITAIALYFALVSSKSLVALLLLGYDGVTQFFVGVVLGMFWRGANKVSVGCGLLVGEILVAWLVLSGHDPVFGLNAGFAALIANIMVTVCAGLVTQHYDAAPARSYYPESDDAAARLSTGTDPAAAAQRGQV